MKIQRHTDLDVYCKAFDAATLYSDYDEVMKMLVGMINNPEVWIIKPPTEQA